MRNRTKACLNRPEAIAVSGQWKDIGGFKQNLYIYKYIYIYVKTTSTYPEAVVGRWSNVFYFIPLQALLYSVLFSFFFYCAVSCLCITVEMICVTRSSR